ncbi:MAG: hypothetical protein OEZ58_06055 [Gammaproteobacteria bacterium]|nr:hypothetical protein [Gammaproteobacteria bacterium]MDH5728532.1 hypothetical protein [Gammaproteobacteria bacterium]
MERLDLKIGSVSLIENNITEIHFYPHHELQIDEVKHLTEICAEYTQGINPLIVIIPHDFSISFNAIRHAAKAKTTKKVAIVFAKPAMMSMFNVVSSVLKRFNAAYETRGFHTKSDALKWLC